MTNNELFDKHAKDLLGDYSPPVHPRIWEGIVAAREKRRPAGFWLSLLNSRNLLLLAALLLASGTGAWFWINHNARPGSNGEANTNAAAQPTAAQPPADQSANLSSTENNNLNNNSSADNTTNTTVTTTGTNNAVTGKNLSSTTSTSNMVPAVTAPVRNNNQYNNPVAFTDAVFPGTGRKRNTNGNTRISTTAPEATEDLNTETTLSAEDIPTGGTLLGRLNYIAERIAARKLLANEMKKRLPATYLPDCPAQEKNASGNKKYIEVYAGPDYAFRSFKDTGNSAYLQKRKESTKFTSAYSAGVRYTKVFNNSMSLRAGINYSQINEKFTYVQGNLVQVTYIIDANGDTTGSYITTGTRYKTTHNKYHSVDIPVMVGYEFGNGRLHANISAGPVVNIYSWQKGEVLDMSGKPVTITTGKESSPYQFKTNAGIGFMGSVSVYYKLNDRVHIMAEPYYRYNFSQINKENITLKQKFNNAGLRVGVRVDLP